MRQYLACAALSSVVTGPEYTTCVGGGSLRTICITVDDELHEYFGGPPKNPFVNWYAITKRSLFCIFLESPLVLLRESWFKKPLVVDYTFELTYEDWLEYKESLNGD